MPHPYALLLTLVLERLHSTHQQEKLKTFGEALANSGTGEFVADDKEPFIRTLRDLSLEDLQTLRKLKEISNRPGPLRVDRVPKGDNGGWPTHKTITGAPFMTASSSWVGSNFDAAPHRA